LTDLFADKPLFSTLKSLSSWIWVLRSLFLIYGKKAVERLLKPLFYEVNGMNVSEDTIYKLKVKKC